MALVPAICTQCGARLEVDPAQEAFICSYCNTPFVTEKAINQYIINNNYGEKEESAKYYLDKALSYYKINEEKKAREIMVEARRLEPDNGEIQFFWDLLFDASFRFESYLKSFPQIPSWEIQWIKEQSSIVLEKGETRQEGAFGRYTTEFSELTEYFSMCLRAYDFVRCSKVLESYPALIIIDELRHLLSYCCSYYKDKWPDIELIKFVIDNDRRRIWNPYEIKQLKSRYSNDADRYSYINISDFDIISEGGKQASLYCGGQETGELPPNKELAQLICERYPIPDSVWIAKNKCPICHRRLGFFGSCSACKKRWK